MKFYTNWKSEVFLHGEYVETTGIIMMVAVGGGGVQEQV